MNNKEQKSNNKWIALINIPFQMGIIVFAFAYAGKWLDEKYINPNNIYVKILTLIGIAIAFYNINRQLKEINKMDERK